MTLHSAAALLTNSPLSRMTLSLVFTRNTPRNKPRDGLQAAGQAAAAAAEAGEGASAEGGAPQPKKEKKPKKEKVRRVIGH